MKPGERVRVIKEVSELLSSRGHDEADLTVREFGYDTWDADQRTYSQILSDDKDDEKLLELHTFLLGEDADPTPTPTDQPWGLNPLRMFISHVHEDAAFVGEVKRLMESRFGIDAFVAHDDIEPSRQWRDVIRTGLATCDAMLALWHPRFHASQWCDQEVGWALGRRIPVIPVRPHDFDRSAARDGFLEEHQDFTLTNPRSEWQVAREVLRILLRDTRTHDKAFTAAIESFVNSPGYNHTRWVWPFIAREEHMSSDHLRRLEYAVETNRQVYDANVDFTPVPELVRGLVQRFEPPDPWAGDEPPF